MSLLMDALRKAEADKNQEAAAVDQEKLVLTSDVRPEEKSKYATSPADASDPSINVSFAETVDLGRATRDLPSSSPQPLSTELTLEPLTHTDLTDSPDGIGRQAPASDRTTQAATTPAMPPASGAGQSLDDDSDDLRTASGTPPAPDPLETALAEPQPTRESGITETVASAHTVFEAGTSGPSRRAIAWGLLSAGLIGTLLVGAGYYYFRLAPATQPLPSPSVAIDVEKPVPRALPIVPSRSGPETEAQSVAGIPADAGQPASDTPGPVPPEQPDPGLTDAVAPDIPERPTSEPAPPVTPSTAPREPAAPTIAPPASGPRFDEVRIARSQSATITEALMNEAYTAYVTGNYPAAARAYAAVLERQPQHRDAMLGMAALKLRDGDVAAAHAMYRAVLKRNPNNATAQAALFTLEGAAADGVTESRLKLLLDQGVDSGYIYFSLGNLYARNRRWADAQQAYFEALRHHPTNPDFNYNLAVSLDRIGQRQAAVRYYQIAVDLTDKESAGFDPAQALARLQAIAGADAQ